MFEISTLEFVKMESITQKKRKRKFGTKTFEIEFKKILSHLKSVPSNLKKRETSRYKQLTSSFGPKMFYCGIFEMKLENYCHILNQENASIRIYENEFEKQFCDIGN